jgi:hypothetical protein
MNWLNHKITFLVLAVGFAFVGCKTSSMRSIQPGSVFYQDKLEAIDEAINRAIAVGKAPA